MKKSEAKRRPKTSAAQIRVQKGAHKAFFLIFASTRHLFIFRIQDLTELDLPATMKTDFPDPTDLLNFSLTITPDEGNCVLFFDHQIQTLRISHSLRNVQGWLVQLLVCYQHQLSARA